MMTVGVFLSETPTALPPQPAQIELTSPSDVLLRPTSAIDDIDRMLTYDDVMRIAFPNRVYTSQSLQSIFLPQRTSSVDSNPMITQSPKYNHLQWYRCQFHKSVPLENQRIQSLENGRNGLSSNFMRQK
jgi:hypothetical protein